jgi:integrase
MLASNIITIKPRRTWTLAAACDLALDVHWRGMRREASAKSWCGQLVAAFPDKTLATLTTQDINTYIRLMELDGLASWTIHAKVCAVSTLYTVAKANGYDGPEPIIPRPRVKKKLKWWLTPEAEAEVAAWLRSRGKDQMADFVRWTVETGLRVEETLRVQAMHFTGLLTDKPELTIPGTKTEDAQATVALSSAAADIARSHFMSLGGSACLFPMDYGHLFWTWDLVRKQFGWLDIPTATLKALRRSFARRLSANGCPPQVVQQMMRHRSIDTTLDYLKLVGGGYSTEEQRKWL